MTISYQLYYISLIATVIGSIVMAGLLLFKSGRKDTVKPLAFFCVGVAAWVTGYLLIATGRSYMVEAGKFLINLSPLIAATFLHFVLTFTSKSRRALILSTYLVALTSVLLAVLLNAGDIGPWIGFSHYYHLDRPGFALAFVTGLFSLSGHFLLLKESLKTDKKTKYQMVALFAAGGWGLMSSSGFVFESVGLDIFPWPVLLLPGYTLLLTYGILRYELMDVNIWARRTLTWAFILLIPLVAVSALLALFVKFGLTQFSETSLWFIWSLSLAVVLMSAVIQKPAALLAERIVYPGSRIKMETLKKWQSDLESAWNWEQMSNVASALLSGHMGHEIKVISEPLLPGCPLGQSAIRYYKVQDEWRFIAVGWEDATPAIVHTVNIFGTLLATASARLEGLLKIANKEKEILIESHLTDLGRLSATVAHELRNPLNVISMASADCQDEVRKEISLQIQRSQKLIDDLLSYSGKLKIEKKILNLKEELDYILSHYKDKRIETLVEVPPDLTIAFDSHRLHQVFLNLMDNSCSILKETDNPRITINAHTDGNNVKVIFGNNGPEISEKIADEIFRPFVSGRAGGSGLGLAIVQRIMEAHDGKIVLTGRESGNCRFELIFQKGEVKDD